MTSPDAVAPRPEDVNSNEEREEPPTQRDDKVDSRLDSATTSESVQAPGYSLGLTFDPALPAPPRAAAPEAEAVASSSASPCESSPLPTPAKARTPKQAHFTLDPPETRTISPAPAPRRRPSYNRAPSSSSAAHSTPSPAAAAPALPKRGAHRVLTSTLCCQPEHRRVQLPTAYKIIIVCIRACCQLQAQGGRARKYFFFFLYGRCKSRCAH